MDILGLSLQHGKAVTILEVASRYFIIEMRAKVEDIDHPLAHVWFSREGKVHRKCLSCFHLETQSLGIESIFILANDYPELPDVTWKRCPGMGTDKAQPCVTRKFSLCSVPRRDLVVSSMFPGPDLVLKEVAQKLWPWMQVFAICFLGFQDRVLFFQAEVHQLI